MRTRSACALALVVTACASNPDPRLRTPDSVITDAHGGWIVLEMKDGTGVAGELIDVRTLEVRVATRRGLVLEPRDQIAKGTLYTYHPDLNNFLASGALGVLATISNGFFLIFTAPAWMLTETLASRAELGSVKLEYPDDPWEKIAQWARFPQGMPPNLRDADLVHQIRTVTGPPGDVSAPSPGASSASGSSSPSSTPAPPEPPPASR